MSKSLYRLTSLLEMKDAFFLHVTRLAKSNQITSLIRVLFRVEQAEWTNMVDGETAPNVLAALGAVSVLLPNDGQTYSTPLPSPIRLGAAYPIGRVGSALVQGAILVSAFLRAVHADMTRHPGYLVRFAVKNPAAKYADSFYGRFVFVVVRSITNRRAGILLRISSHTIHVIRCCRVFAIKATVATTLCVVADYLERLATCLADQTYVSDRQTHPKYLCSILPRFAGSGTVARVATKHRRHSISIELNPDYCQMITKRLNVQVTLPLEATEDGVSA